MAPLAIVELERVVAVERPAAVVARSAVVPWGDLVLLSEDVGDLSRLRSSRTYVRAIAATYSLCMCVVGVPEHGPENVSRLRRAAVRSQIVADIASTYLAFRRVAREAIRVGGDADRDRLPRPVRGMARDAAFRGPALAAVVGRVVELHVEAFLELDRERLDRRRHGPRFLMADRADLSLIAGELVQVAADAGLVPGEFYVTAFFTSVARVARELLMLGNVV